MGVARPGRDTRRRCAVCGNLTRFDVTSTARTREFVHVDLAGDQVVEERLVLDDAVEHVTCRWCGAVGQVQLVARPDAAAPG